MSEDENLIDAYLDLLPNLPKTEQSRDLLRAAMRARFEAALPEAIERTWELPGIMVNPLGAYLALLREAREVFCAGHFYSCVAMCGILGERLVKDLLRMSVLVIKDGCATQPPEAAFVRFERVEVSGIAGFLQEAGVLEQQAAQAAKNLGALRNTYAHARGDNAEADARKAIGLVHSLVEATVSLLGRVAGSKSPAGTTDDPEDPKREV
jgi:hypothetical protein